MRSDRISTFISSQFPVVVPHRHSVFLYYSMLITFICCISLKAVEADCLIHGIKHHGFYLCSPWPRESQFTHSTQVALPNRFGKAAYACLWECVREREQEMGLQGWMAMTHPPTHSHTWIQMRTHTVITQNHVRAVHCLKANCF